MISSTEFRVLCYYPNRLCWVSYIVQHSDQKKLKFPTK